MENLLEIVRNGLRDVAITCDGASQDDGMGFNKPDSLVAKPLIAKTFWSSADKIKACKLFNKYRGQHGIKIDFETVLKPFIESLKENDKLITIDKTIAIISFSYDSSLVTKVKSTGAKFEPTQKVWGKALTEQKDLDLIEIFAKENDFEIQINNPFISEVKKEIITPVQTKPVFEGKLLVDNKKIIITFDYSPAKVSELKLIDVAKKYAPETKSWNILTSSLDNKIIHELTEYAKRNKIEIDEKIYSFVKVEIIKEVTLEELKARYPFAMDYQLEGVKYHLEIKNAYNGDTMGLGKAQSLDSKILTPTGYKLMGDIQIGDEIINQQGTISKVIGVYPQGQKDVYEVTFSDNTSTECCDEHLWNVQTPTMRYHNPNNYYTKELKDFKDDLYNKNNNKKWFIPLVKPIQFTEKNYIIHPYILGTILGDGGISQSSIIITKDNDELFTNILSFLPNHMKLNDVSKSISKRLVSTTSKNLFIRELKTLKLMGLKSPKKFIPEQYKLGSIEQRTLLLQGLLDTDGYIDKTGYILQYTSVSYKLIKDVQFLIQSLGGIATLSKKTGSYTKDDIKIICENAYTLTISLPSNIQPFRTERKKVRFKPKTKYLPYRAFQSVKYIGKKECQCIKVDSIDSLYITDNCIVTHNTIQTLMTIDYSEKLPAVIIAPNSLKYNWKKEVEKFIPNRSCYVISAKDKVIPTGYEIYVINYDIVEKKLEELKTFNFKFIACDEAHLLKNKDTKRFKAVKSLVDELAIENRVLLSGTCITNRPKELVSQLKLLGVLNKIVAKDWDFFIKYCDATQTDFGWDLNGASNLKELNEKLSNTCYIRREKEQVLKQLPAKQKTTVELEIDNRKEYNKALENLVEYLSEIRGESVNLQAEQLVQIEVLKQIVVKGKIQTSIEWIQNVLDNDEKLVVFAHHKTTIKALQEAFPNSLTIDGSTEAEQRQKTVDQFQNNPDKKLIICSIKSASVGLTLTASSNVAFLELTWTPADLDQAEDRCHRIGQLNNVNVYYLLGKDTIEDLRIMPLIESKRNIFNAVARGENVAKKDLKTSIVNDFIKSLLKDQKKNLLAK